MQDQAGVSPADPEALVATFADQATAEFFVTGEPAEYPAPDDTVAGTPAGEFRDGVDPALVSARQADEQRLADAAVACGGAELDPVEAQIRSELESVGDRLAGQRLGEQLAMAVRATRDPHPQSGDVLQQVLLRLQRLHPDRLLAGQGVPEVVPRSPGVDFG
jgi:hypothetical protein